MSQPILNAIEQQFHQLAEAGAYAEALELVTHEARIAFPITRSVLCTCGA